MFHRRFYMPGFPKTEFQIYIVSASDQNYVEVRIGRTTSDTFLNSGRAAYFSFCEIADVYNRFGAFMHADEPVGVMITSCHQETMFDCDNKELGFVASTILPPILDCEFIVFSRLNPLLDPQHDAHDELRIMNSDSYFVIITINDETELFLDGPYYMLTLKIQNDRPLHLHANLPVVCYYVSKSKDCTWGMSSSLVLPNELFIFSYAISVPFPYNSSRSAGTAFLIFVVTDDQFPMILMDEIYLMDFDTTVTKVDGTKKYQVRYLQISNGLHYSYSEDVSNYGLYLFGRKDFGTYFHPAGFYDTSREDRPEDVEYGPMFPGDLVDNDEDGSVDEELLDKDVDHDNQNSEDLRRETAVHGRWGQWNTWACQDMCSLSYFERRRTCSRPSPLFEGSQCQGHDLEVKDTVCGGQQCDTVLCPDGYYGINCELQCQNCGGDCNKRDGSCQFCKPGWIGLYCHVACPPMTYGFECQHSCSQKCNGKDCIDRVYGYCHQAVDVKSIMITYYVVIFVVLCGFLYLIFYNKKKNDEPLEIITVKRVSSKEFVLNTRKFN
ncbi:uncharacterized protein LOC131931014 [Physella acuta]|uniref:uncharacterized protein LOC131931014 n=1 Tax=Physella acuta TaxID=109671 RepID=UPI0027DCC166|nr:uncharacterized protein LOC131931014 [Physella acuta]